MLATAQKITEILKELFSTLPEFSDQVTDDAAFIEQALKERSQSEELAISNLPASGMGRSLGFHP